MILSSSDVVDKLLSSAIIRIASDILIVNNKPIFNVDATGVKIYINKYPSTEEYTATWKIWLIDYEKNPVDVLVSEIERVLPSVSIIRSDTFIELSTTEILNEKTITGPPGPSKDEVLQSELRSSLDQRFNELTQEINDRLLLVGPGRPGRDGKDGQDGKDGEDGKDGRDGLDIDATTVRLDDLADVEAFDPEKGQVLMWSGEAWKARYVPQYGLASGGGGRTDTDILDLTGQTWTHEPLGHEDRTESAIAFDEVSRIFTISPIGESFHVWCAGKRYTFTETQSVTIPDTSGLYFIFFEDGILKYDTDYFTWNTEAPTAYLYWNATLNQAIYFGDERHGIVLDWQTHEYLHRTRGAHLASGFDANSYTIEGDGSLDSDAQISINGGTFFDEDLKIQIVHSNTPESNNFQQDLQGPGRFPVMYLVGTEWRIDAATDFPVKQGTARIQYNLNTSGTWSTVDASSNHYVLSFLVATNNIDTPVLAILGQDEYVNIADAEEFLFADLNLDGFPSLEFVPLYKLIYQAGN